MTVHSAPLVLAALGVLACTAPRAAEVDTAHWKCEACPFPKGTSGALSVGVGTVTAASTSFGDETGLQRKGAHAVISGEVNHAGGDGLYAQAIASDLGLDTRRLEARAGREGLLQLDAGYAELPRWLSTGASTPYLGNGGGRLSLPAGYPAPGTASMPLAGTLQPIDLGYKLKRYDLGGSLVAGGSWTYSIGLHRDERDGTRPTSVSYFASAAQVVAPVVESTDRLRIAAAYAGRELQLTLGYEISRFRNEHAGLIVDNPFLPVVPGATQAQLSLAPANEFQQVSLSAGYTITPTIRLSLNLAGGRSTQDAAFLAPTQNAALLPSVTLPATSLGGRDDSFDGSLRITAAVTPDLLLTASYARDVRDNRTPVRKFTVVVADLVVSPALRSNTPFGFKQDRLKLSADYRAGSRLRLSAGVDENDLERSYQEVVHTRETTVWGRGTLQARDDLSLALRVAHGDRHRSTYGTATWFGEADNPLLRKFNLAARTRDSAGLRGDYAVGEKVSLGASVDYASDAYRDTAIGLKNARSMSLGLDVTAAIGEVAQVGVFGQAERQLSRQAGSSSFSVPDWQSENRDRSETIGVNLRYAAIPDKLDVGAELEWSRSRGDLTVSTPTADPGFPAAAGTISRAKIFGSYRLRTDLRFDVSLLHQRLRTNDWQFDGVNPAALGAQSPNHDVSVVQLSLRYSF